MARRSSDYDPDERGRYAGDDGWHSPIDNPEWSAIVMQQEAAKRAAFDEHQASYYRAPAPSSDDRHCPVCHGHGTVTDAPAYGPTALITCHRCGGAVTR